MEYTANRAREDQTESKYADLIAKVEGMIKDQTDLKDKGAHHVILYKDWFPIRDETFLQVIRDRGYTCNYNRLYPYTVEVRWDDSDSDSD